MVAEAPPALAELALKASVFCPTFFSLTRILTTFELPAGTPPTFFDRFAPPPVTFSVTPEAAALPLLVIRALKVGLPPFLVLDGPVTLTLLILAVFGWVTDPGLTVWVKAAEVEAPNSVLPE